MLTWEIVNFNLTFAINVILNLLKVKKVSQLQMLSSMLTFHLRIWSLFVNIQGLKFCKRKNITFSDVFSVCSLERVRKISVIYNKHQTLILAKTWKRSVLKYLQFWMKRFLSDYVLMFFYLFMNFAKTNWQERAHRTNIPMTRLLNIKKKNLVTIWFRTIN